MWHLVKTLGKQHSRRLQLIMETIIWTRSSNMSTIFNLDIMFINYSWMMASCQTIVNLHQIGLKVATRDVIGTGNPYMTTIFIIDLTFVNYSWNNGHLQYWLYVVWKFVIISWIINEGDVKVETVFIFEFPVQILFHIVSFSQFPACLTHVTWCHHLMNI